MKKIAFMYDFDKTLSIKDMQEFSLIPSLGYTNAAEFWSEVSTLTQNNRMDSILSYMYMVLAKSPNGLHYKDLQELGKDVEFFPGVEQWFDRINEYGRSLGFEIEHYIISSGMTEMIEGTSIAKYFRKIYACKYLYDKETQLAIWPSTVVNYTTKTQYIFRINKQVLNEDDEANLNTYTPKESRPIPFTRMIYVGDGITDVPCMRLVKEYGGHSIVVVNNKSEKSIQTGKKLIKDGRANYMLNADYTENSDFDKVAKLIINHIKASEDLLEAEKINESL